MIKLLCRDYSYTYPEGNDLIAVDWNIKERILVDKINELIEEVNKLKENK